MKCMLIRTQHGLRGASEQDQVVWSKFKRRIVAMKPGRFMRVEFSSPRNGKHHRLFMALLQLVAENSELYSTPEKALVAVKLAVGFYDPIVDPRTGEIVPNLHSVSYEKMGQEDFDRFYSAALDGVLQVILPTMDRDTAERLMDMIVEGWA